MRPHQLNSIHSHVDLNNGLADNFSKWWWKLAILCRQMQAQRPRLPSRSGQIFLGRKHCVLIAGMLPGCDFSGPTSKTVCIEILVRICIYIYMVAPPQNLHFSKKHWFLLCFRHILTSRFGKLRLGGHISSSYIKIYDIHCTTKRCGMFRNTSVSKTEKLKNCFFQRHPGRDSP